MKKITIAIFVAILGVCIWLAIRPLTTGPRTTGPVRTVTPEQGPDGRQSDPYSSDAELKMAKESQTAKVPIRSDEIVLQVQTLNLDSDADDEQIILVKKKDDPDERIRLIVVDYDPARNEYYRSWEDATEATRFMTFSVFEKDIIGDHNLNLVCMGLNNNNEQTLSVFWKTRAPNGGKGLYYTPICRLAADGSIKIDEQERSEAYQLGQINGVSFNIVTYSRNKSSANMLDQVETTYAFNFKAAKYEKTQEALITGDQVASGKLKDILNGDEKRFEDFLQGIWYKTTVSDPKDPQAQLIMFDRHGNNVIFNTDNLQEVYTWKSSHSTQYGIYVSTENELVSTMSRFVDIELKAVDTIAVKTYDDVNIKVEVSGKWDGIYRKLGTAIPPALPTQPVATGPKPGSPVTPPVTGKGATGTPGSGAPSAQGGTVSTAEMLKPDILKGTFQGDDGSELSFADRNRVVLRKDGKEQAGGYAVYALRDQVVFEIKLLKPSGLPAEVRTYIMQLEQRDTATSVDTILTLIPARIGMSGVVPLHDPSITFDQRKKK